MTEIVKATLVDRLRWRANADPNNKRVNYHDSNLEREAAEEIERLERQLKQSVQPISRKEPIMPSHPDYTCFADRVVYNKDDNRFVAFVTAVLDPHTANLLFYCTDSHAWHEAAGVPFGTSDDGGAYFTNPDA